LLVTGLTYNPAAGEVGNVANISFTDTSSNTSGTSNTNGLNISSTVNTSGAGGQKDINAINVSAPIITACTDGNCVWSGMEINTVTSGEVSTLTSNGLLINPTGVSAGTLNAINIGNITAEAGTEYGITIGTGWDRGLTVGDSSNYTAIGVNGTAGIVYSGTSRPLITWVMSPEYPGAALFADGSNNTGSMISDYTNAQATGSRATYYEWNATSGTMQDYDIIVRFTLPSNFAAWEETTNATIVFDYITESATITDSQIDAAIKLESSDSDDATETDMASTSWTTAGIDESELGDCNAAGETCLIEIKMQSKSGNYARIGDITLKYRAAF
jgi:hypothetical protein